MRPSRQARMHRRDDVIERIFQSYFEGDGRMVDQVCQRRLPEGMIRCYLVHDKVAGFGHQAINALYPAPPGAPPYAAPPPGPRLYHPPTIAKFQLLKHLLEQEWVPKMQQLLEMDIEDLPVLWDCDFLLGARNKVRDDTYVLCEINVSSVSPFPDFALPLIARATLANASHEAPMKSRCRCALAAGNIERDSRAESGL